MPRIARIFIKTGLLWFLMALVTATGMEFEWIEGAYLRPLFWHMLMVGWITQIIFGVSMWMFPGRTKEEGFWPQKWAWLTWIGINAGLFLRALAEPMLVYSDLELWNFLVVGSAILQFVAGIFYVIEMWPRILSKKQRREKRKKKRKRAKNTKNK